MPVIHDTFTLHRIFPHGRERVFAALADPALKQRWYADQTMEPQKADMDFRVGGIEYQRYVLREGSPFPGVVLENEGRFENIVEGERVVVSTSMTFGGQRISTSLLTFELEEQGEGCALRFTHQAVFYEGADGPEVRRAGWETMLDALARSLAS